MIAGSPLIGYGPDTYGVVYAQFYPTTAEESAENITSWDPHNLILAQMTSSGILGLLAFGWIVFTFCQRVYLQARYSDLGEIHLLAAALLASVTAYLVQSQFNPSGLVALVIFWLVMGIGCGLK